MVGKKRNGRREAKGEKDIEMDRQSQMALAERWHIELGTRNSTGEETGRRNSREVWDRGAEKWRNSTRDCG